MQIVSVLFILDTILYCDYDCAFEADIQVEN